MLLAWFTHDGRAAFAADALIVELGVAAGAAASFAFQDELGPRAAFHGGEGTAGDRELGNVVYGGLRF